MRRYLYIAFVLPFFSLVAGSAGCGDDGIQPGGNDQEVVQTALLQARPGSVIQLGSGTFHFTMDLSLTVNNVTIRGRGADKTILSFKDQTLGSQGLLVKANDFLVEELAIEDAKADGIKVEGGKGVTFRKVRVEWTNGPATKNGSYGLYPVQCENVLIEDSLVRGASDAGIYVGQSKNIIVRRSTARQNVAGIEIENSSNADVYDNTSTENTGGIAVFSLPGLQVKSCHSVRVYNNHIIGNNTDNFAPPQNTVAAIPGGTGTFIMASGQVEAFGNTIQDNQTVSMGIISYLITQTKYDDASYDPYPSAIYIHDNNFDGGGDRPDPSNQLGIALAAFVKTPIPDVVFDGYTDPSKLIDGKVPDDLRICVHNNKQARRAFGFANIDGAGLLMMPPMPKIVRDLAPYDCTHQMLPKVTIPGVGE